MKTNWIKLPRHVQVLSLIAFAAMVLAFSRSIVSEASKTELVAETFAPIVSANSIGAVGDVKYSILDPEKFAKENGDGWVPMMGQDIKGTDLWKLTQIEKLPDARGVFIRGMNLKRDTSKGDTAGDRLVGDYQVDQFRDHTHSLAYQGRTIAGDGNARTELGEGRGNTSGASVGAGDETRPRNITLYTYIKVSNPVVSQ